MPTKKSGLVRGGGSSGGQSGAGADTQAARARREKDEAGETPANAAGSHRTTPPGGSAKRTAPHGEQGQKGAKDGKSGR